MDGNDCRLVDIDDS